MSGALRFRDVRAPIHGDVMGGPWSFAVEEGAFLAVQAAPSVADTIMELLVGNAEPDAGHVEVMGERPGTLSRFQRHRLLRRLGMAFQREGLVSNLSLEENLALPLVFASGFTRTEARAAAAQAMEELDLSQYANRRPASLTREARVLTALARAALRRPEILVLEHLTANLPDAMAEEALRWCRDRSPTMLVLVPGPSEVLDRLADGWLPRLKGTREEGLRA